MDLASQSSSVTAGRTCVRIALVALLAATLAGRAGAQQDLSPVVAKSPDNVAAGAVGQASGWDLSATDCTYKVEQREVWIVDSHSADEPFILKFKADDLALTPPVSIPLRLPAELGGSTVLGISEIPHGQFKGLNFILIDTTYGTGDPPDPQIGVFRDDGTMLSGVPFNGVVGVDPTARLTSISVNPGPGIEEIAVYDAENHAFYVLDFLFGVVQGPAPCLGFGHFFSQPWQLGPASLGMGMGITYNGPDTVLVTAGFFNLFETRFALEYDAAGGRYTGRGLDLSAATGEGAIDVVFAALAAGSVGQEDVVFALNVSDESLYAFSPSYQDQPEPVSLDPAGCIYDPATGQYTISWELNPAAIVDSVAIFENGVQVATLPPEVTRYQSPLPLVGKVFVEVATEAHGVVSGVRPVCQLENTQTPRLSGVSVDGSALGDFEYGDLAVTKRPSTPEEFRMYLYLESSFIGVLDHTLEVVDVYTLTDPRTETALPRQGIGLTLAPLEGETHLAALDPNGLNNDGFASVAFFPLENDAATPGDDRSVATRIADTVDLTDLPESLALRNWDYVGDGETGYYVAAGTIDDGGVTRFVLVRLEFDHLFVGTHMVDVPQRTLTPFVDEPLVGIAVSALPSGHLMVAGGHPFLDSYSEAVLTTKFGVEPETAARFVGYAQGLAVPGQFFGFGPDIGPRRLDGIATAYFPPAEEGGAGIGVTYHTTQRPILVTNPSGTFLTAGVQLAVHAENEVSSPGLVAEQLLESKLLFQSGAAGTTDTVSPSFAGEAASIDYYVTVVNLAGFFSIPAVLEVLLDGVVVPEASQEVVFEPGTNLRIRIPERPEKNCQVRIVNRFNDATELRVIIGAIADLGETPVPAEPLFRRGDCNGDGGVQLADAVFGLGALFQGNDQPTCLDACDLDDGGSFNIGDMIAILGYLFQGNADPAPPGPLTCGRDPADDDLARCVYDACP